MVSAISSSVQAVQYSSSTSSDDAAQEAALEKQIQALEDQAKAAQDEADAARLQQQAAALQAKLDALKAADAKKADQGQSTTSAAAARQAEFDNEPRTQSHLFTM
ncbi:MULTISPECIES: hypothetical protein [unclassified Mesorhizobium]|uniref:hypothetical protein n=1 Tax=unclassified Mesorhizobium TaxID=325217 RepID=UPI00112DF524|nr:MULTISPECIES: hypothetical protein [unclassified Mesorhizobium]TPK94683.1 hypothetical protein FJ567_24330 [Mesorhizobium sp. B2-4-16]TPL67297.1 hypothetical protein FJ956_19870 [Mesorhizobium sp. B2-4-3]